MSLDSTCKLHFVSLMWYFLCISNLRKTKQIERQFLWVAFTLLGLMKCFVYAWYVVIKPKKNKKVSSFFQSFIFIDILVLIPVLINYSTSVWVYSASHKCSSVWSRHLKLTFNRPSHLFLQSFPILIFPFMSQPQMWPFLCFSAKKWQQETLIVNMKTDSTK